MKTLNQFHLSGLRAVEAVARLGSIKAAAEELGVTVGAVSQQVQKTEAQLGVQLFERQNRILLPTPHVLAMQPHLTSAMSSLATAVATTQRGREDALTISVAPVFAGKWLVWHLKAFNRVCPDVRVRVEATVDLIDPDTSDVDLCIRVGKGPYPGLNAEKLLNQRVFPVCSPALAEEIREPADIGKLPIIRDPGQIFSWSTWLDLFGLDESILQDGPTFSDGSLCLDAAIAGQGVFLAWETLAVYAVKSGQVISPFPQRPATGLGYWLISGKNAPRTKAKQAFGNWLKEELQDSIGRPKGADEVTG
ncbi:MAG: LysR family transcriptional regulator [Roseibium sp.]|uniref:LysR substrate-binding domain-containing protein n=1 Tax=Roseibium sp. TaxID=1936156 RepID=UPI001B0BDA98|nr:LysR substrate-binding domain-containing protein [Roseibium sp.]MBO6508032.1 LysR family transcriptional regulator [Roseibium sp.]MBO6890316.1 LysR family transcriptional regulator [Roseibium sp.]MBO6932658.1 LysR family transcriptional regulator [Roseibium sp.]